MKYYLIEIATYTNGQKDSKGIYEYETRDKAFASYHKKMGGAMDNTEYASELLAIINSAGGVELSDNFVREVKEEA